MNEPVDCLVSGHQRTEQNDQDDSHAGEVLDPAIAIGELLRGLPSSEREGNPERYGSPCVPDIVDRVREQCDAVRRPHNNELNGRSDCQNHKRPLDRPDTSGGGGDTGVNDPVSMPATTVVAMPHRSIIVVMSG